MSTISQEQQNIQNENISQNSAIDNNNSENIIQKFFETKDKEEEINTLPNSSDKKNTNKNIQENLNNFFKKTFSKEEENKDEINNNKKINKFEEEENYEKFEKLFLEKK